MLFNKLTPVFLILILCVNSIQSQDRLLIDVESDIPQNGNWEVDCDNGYANLTTDYDCGSNNGGGILILPEELNGEKGFWTGCAFHACQLKYHVQREDTFLRARLYQQVVQTQVSFDGITWSFIDGKGWIELEETLGDSGRNQVSLRFSHFSPIMFSVLDKITIYGNFDPSTTEPSPTTEFTTEDPIITTTSPECPTTPKPEPCDCCDRCPERTREIHHHHYYPPSKKINYEL